MPRRPIETADEPFVTYSWDSPDLPPRTESQRCARHEHCAYRDDDPALCPICHRNWTIVTDPARDNQTVEEHNAKHVRDDERRAGKRAS
jgi:hypothetical protein